MSSHLAWAEPAEREEDSAVVNEEVEYRVQGGAGKVGRGEGVGNFAVVEVVVAGEERWEVQ